MMRQYQTGLALRIEASNSAAESLLLGQEEAGQVRAPPPLAQSHRDQTRALIRRHVRRGPSAPLPNQPRTRLALTHAPLAGREQSHLRAAHGA